MACSPRIVQVLCASLLGLVAPGLLPAGASARQLRSDDGRGDVWQAVYDDQDVLAGWVEAGSPGNADVLSTMARHRLRRIVFTTWYVSLERGPGQNRFSTQQAMVFDHGDPVTVRVDTFHQWAGESFIFNGRTGNGIRCDRLRHVIDYDADTVRVSIPRACVHRPRWLRYAGGGSALSGGATEPAADDHNYFDNALNAGHRRGVRPPNLSARVFRG